MTSLQTPGDGFAGAQRHQAIRAGIGQARRHGLRVAAQRDRIRVARQPVVVGPVKGRKRFILVDTQGLILAVWVCAASISEKAGAMELLQYIKEVRCLRRLCRRIKLVWVDGGYRGEDLTNWVKNIWGWTWQVVMRW
jgi:hypothetical protein